MLYMHSLFPLQQIEVFSIDLSFIQIIQRLKLKSGNEKKKKKNNLKSD